MIGFSIQVLLEAFSLFSAIEEEIFIRVFAALVSYNFNINFNVLGFE